MEFKNFGKWSNDIHLNPEQLRRISAASKINKENAFYSGNEFKIKGSEEIPYTVSLSSCTCKDFSSRKLPCKHIYFLAISEGLINNETVEYCKQNYPYIPYVNSTERKSINDSAIEELEKLPEDVQQKLQNYLYEFIYHNEEYQKIDKKSAEALNGCRLVEISKASFKDNVSFMKKNEIANILKEFGKKLPSSLTKKDLPEWCETNAPEIDSKITHFFLLTFSSEFKPSHRKIYNILIKKFRQDTCTY